jgi:ribosomal protein L11 methyltransferase
VDDLGQKGMQVQYRFHTTPDQNWNEEWEKKFHPVVIREKVLIRAPFHDSGQDLPQTIVIEPKMSFGTGHHHTTRLMIEGMMDSDLRGHRVLDMGCGTGVLAIFAFMCGASQVMAIDNDQWAYENALENAARNAVGNPDIRLGDVALLKDHVFDVILANITRNILVRDLSAYEKHLENNGILLVSGFLAEDVQFILNAAYEAGLEHRQTMESANWILLEFVKP